MMLEIWQHVPNLNKMELESEKKYIRVISTTTPTFNFTHQSPIKKIAAFYCSTVYCLF